MGNRVRLKRGVAHGLAFAAVTIILRLAYAGLPFDAHDEGYYAVVARETVRGSRLYADLWYLRPPLLNTVYAWCYRFSLSSGIPYDVSVRLLSGLFAAATVGVVAGVLFSKFSTRAALLGSTFAALAGASLTLQNEANAETWMMLPATLSALLVLHVALDKPSSRRSAWLMVLAGILTGLAAAFKQVALVNLALPTVAWLVCDRARVRRWVVLSAAFVSGTLCVWVGLLVRLAMIDDLRAFLYFAWFRGAMYVRHSRAEFEPLRLLLGNLTGLGFAFTITAALALALFGGVLARPGAPTRARKTALFAFGWLALSIVGVSASGRFYLHYFIQATLPLALLLSASADEFVATDEGRQVSSATVAAILIVGLLPPVISQVIDVRTIGSKTAKRGVYKDLGARLPQDTAPGSSLLVWGTCASVKAYCTLPSATRLPVVYDDYGWSPQSSGRLLGEEFPGTGEVVLADMRRSEPDTLVLTAPLRSRSPSGSSSGRGPIDGGGLEATLSATVARRYKVVERGRGYTVLRRKRPPLPETGADR